MGVSVQAITQAYPQGPGSYLGHDLQVLLVCVENKRTCTASQSPPHLSLLPPLSALMSLSVFPSLPLPQVLTSLPSPNKPLLHPICFTAYLLRHTLIRPKDIPSPSYVT